jgi:predicted nucleic acid-binding protein
MRSTEERQRFGRVIFIDTSAFYSLLDRSDALHEVATRYLRESASKGSRVVTSNFVLAESMPWSWAD